MKTFLISYNGIGAFSHYLVIAESEAEARELYKEKFGLWLDSSIKEIESDKKQVLEIVDYDDPTYEG